jgi:DNA polymerase III alpha subunit
MQKKTPLNDYTLWFDGTVEVDPKNLEKLVVRGVPLEKLAVTSMTPEVVMFNRISSVKLAQKSGCEFTVDWAIPDDYRSLDIYGYMIDRIIPGIKPDDLKDVRYQRILDELDEYDRRGLLPLLKILIYVVETFRGKDVVWGVGRGSSCASYILYLLGIHCVDSVKYDIPITEFFH